MQSVSDFAGFKCNNKRKRCQNLSNLHAKFTKFKTALGFYKIRHFFHFRKRPPHNPLVPIHLFPPLSSPHHHHRSHPRVIIVLIAITIIIIITTNPPHLYSLSSRRADWKGATPTLLSLHYPFSLAVFSPLLPFSFLFPSTSSSSPHGLTFQALLMCFSKLVFILWLLFTLY